MNLAVLPSPTQGVWHIGPVPIRGYALAIIAGVIAAVWIAERRWVNRGGQRGEVVDVAVVAVPAGLIGGRLYHVITTPDPYFGPDGNLVDILKIWQGGLGIWGAIAVGALGAWLVCRRRKIRFAAFADALAPALVVAQGIGRLGNWFNNELYGGPTDLPWRLRIYVWDDSTGRAVTDAAGDPLVLGYFHPTFLYELIWNLFVAVLVVLLDRRFRMGRGNVFALYVAAYCVGRFFIERVRIDEAEIILGQRINVWTSILVFACAVLWIVLHRGPREESVYYVRDDDTEPDRPGGESGTAETAEPTGRAGDTADTADESERTSERTRESKGDDTADDTGDDTAGDTAGGGGERPADDSPERSERP